MKVIAVNIGERKKVLYKKKEIETGIYKYPVDHQVFISELGLENDAICDTKWHGGINQAVYAYSANHYDFWKTKFPNQEWQWGMFGENLTLSELNEEEIHVGDVFQSGDLILEATLQRDPCYKLGIRFNNMKIVKAFWNTTFCGVYFKVLQKGSIQKDAVFIKMKTNATQPTIADLLRTKKK